jgi:two-component system, sensor histidine kinase and response regulator
MTEPVDVSSLLQLRALQRPGQPDMVGRIVGRFLEETDERIARLQTAVGADDPHSLERAAHALKGISGTVGAHELRELALQLEQLGHAGHTRGAAELLSALERAYARARPTFEALRSGV